MCDKPLISVIVPVYNPGKYFQACIDSIVNQTYRNLEIILIDDGSTDGSAEACDDYAQKDTRIKVIHQENVGVSKARNAGLRVATGDYFHFPDSDDYIELDSYEYLLGLIDKTQCDVINFEHYITYPEKEEAHSYPDDFYGAFRQREALGKLAGGVQFCWNKLFPKFAIKDSDGELAVLFREDIVRGEDTLFAASAIERVESVWFDKQPLYHYVQTEQSACRGRFRLNQLSILQSYMLFFPIYGKYPEVWDEFRAYEQGILISIYFDLWNDSGDKKIKKMLLSVIHKHYVEVRKLTILTPKQRIKYALFDINADLFCLIHKLNVKGFHNENT